jgi:hypothetical protein
MGRFLTPGERQMVSAALGPSILLDTIRVTDHGFIPGQDVPTTPTGQTVFWPTDMPGRPYSDDFSSPTTSVAVQALFLHEVAHIWQSQHDVSVTFRGFFLQIQYRFFGQDVYSLEGITPGSIWSDLNIEQQATVIENIYRLQHNLAPASGNLSLESYQQILNSSAFHTEQPKEPVQVDFLSPQCFVRGTEILLADGSSKPIEQIQIGDLVLAFKGNSALTPARVTRLFENITTDLLELSPLSNQEGGADETKFNLLTVTPGHLFFDARRNL